MQRQHSVFVVVVQVVAEVEKGLHHVGETEVSWNTGYVEIWLITLCQHTLVPRATLRGVAELHAASSMPQWRMFVTCCYF